MWIRRPMRVQLTEIQTSRKKTVISTTLFFFIIIIITFVLVFVLLLLLVVHFCRQVSSETGMWSPRPYMMPSCSWGATAAAGARETGREREMAAERWWANVRTTQSTRAVTRFLFRAPRRAPLYVDMFADWHVVTCLNHFRRSDIKGNLTSSDHHISTTLLTRQQSELNAVRLAPRLQHDKAR